MPIKNINHSQSQTRLLGYKLSDELNPKNKLYQLRSVIDWEVLENYVLKETQVKKYGRDRHSIRVLLGLLMLQAMNNTSDKLTSEELTENMYWQYFCGYEYIEKNVNVSASSIRRFRQFLGEEGLNEILKEVIKVGIKTGSVKKKDLTTTIIDTTVQKKNVKHPHDAILMEKAREKLVSLCNKTEIYLNETYAKHFKRQTMKLWRYKENSKAKKRKKIMKNMKTRLGRLIRLFDREIENQSKELKDIEKSDLLKIKKIYAQSALTPDEKKDYKKENEILYSFHAPEVECIGKGKLHKPYEFGNKVSVVVSGKNNFVLGVKSFHGNPYDGHTLSQSVDLAEGLTGEKINKVFVDMGYRGSNLKEKNKLYLPNTKKSLSESDKKMKKRRSAIEPIIGHLKKHGRMACNYLRGVIGDILNPIISSVGLNLRNIVKRLTPISP